MSATSPCIFKTISSIINLETNGVSKSRNTPKTIKRAILTTTPCSGFESFIIFKRFGMVYKLMSL